MAKNKPPNFDPLRFVDTKSDQPAASPAAPAAKRPKKKSREELIAENAYYRAERRGFATGFEHEDWLAAEAEVDAPKKRAGARRKEPLG
jgi:hypothetical protein